MERANEWETEFQMILFQNWADFRSHHNVMVHIILWYFKLGYFIFGILSLMHKVHYTWHKCIIKYL